MFDKKYPLIIAGSVLIIILLTTTIINSIRLSNLKSVLDANRDIIVEESGRNRKAEDYFNNINSMIAYDLNRTRASLGLPVSEYPIADIGDEETDNAALPDKDREIFDAVSVLLQTEADNKKSIMIGKFLKNDIISDYLNNEGIKAVKYSNTSYKLYHDKDEIVTVSADSENDVLLKSADGSSLRTASASREAVQFIVSGLEYVNQINEKSRIAQNHLK